MAIMEKKFDFIPLLKGQAIFFLKNPPILTMLLIGIAVASFLTYNQMLYTDEKAAIAALLFTSIWGALYIIVPFFLFLFIILAVVALVTGVIYVASSVGGSHGLGVAAGGGLIVALALALMAVAMLFGPGYLAYEALNSSGYSEGMSIAAGIGVTLLLFLVLAILYRLVWPVFATILWIFWSASVSMKMVSAILGIGESVDFARKFNHVDLPGSINEILPMILELLDIFVALMPPGPLMKVMLVFAAIMSLFVLVKGSNVGTVKLWPDKSKAAA